MKPHARPENRTQNTTIPFLSAANMTTILTAFAATVKLLPPSFGLQVLRRVNV